jgi:hypothetical protein
MAINCLESNTIMSKQQYLAQVNREYTIAFRSFGDRKDYISQNNNAKAVGSKGNKLPIIGLHELLFKQVAIVRDEFGHLFVYPDYEDQGKVLAKRCSSEVLLALPIDYVIDDCEDVVNLDDILKAWFINQTMNDSQLDTLVHEDVGYDRLLQAQGLESSCCSSIDCRHKDNDQKAEELKRCTCKDDDFFDDDETCVGCTDCDSFYRLSTCPIYRKNNYADCPVHDNDGGCTCEGCVCHEGEACTCGYEKDDDPVNDYIMSSNIRSLIETYYV